MTNVTGAVGADFAAAMSRVHEQMEEFATNPAIKGAIADFQRNVARLYGRAQPLPDEFERIEIKQDRGPTVEFSGKLLTSTSFETRGPKPLNILLEIFETQAGALIAVSSSVLAGGEGREDARVTVVPPQDDVQAMRFEVMQAFGWEVRARSMVRKLGWSLRLDVA